MADARIDSSAARDNMAMPALLDLSSRFAPPVEHVQAVIVGARAIVAKGPYHRGLLLTALAESDPGDGRAVHHARRLLCRLASVPSLPAWLDDPYRTRGEVLRLLVRAAKVFGVRHRGGWVCSSSAPTPSAPSPSEVAT